MSRKLENWYPVILGLTAGIAVWLTYSLFPKDHSFDPVYTAIFTASAIVLGFHGTAVSILMALEDRPIVQKLKSTDRYKEYMRFIRNTVLTGLISLLLAIALSYSKALLNESTHKFLFALMIAISVMSYVSCYRNIRILFSILEYPNN